MLLYNNLKIDGGHLANVNFSFSHTELNDKRGSENEK